VNPFRERVGLGPPVILAHRGDSAHAPENTLEAAQLGQRAGAFAWELDVHRTRDGVPVVIHDETLTRSTNVSTRYAHDPRRESGYRVADFDWDEIRTLDAGSWFIDPSGPPRSASAFGTLDILPVADRVAFGSGRIRIPSLLDALALTRDLDWLVNVELKTFPDLDPGLLEAVLGAIDTTGMADSVLLSSFDHEDVARAAQLRPEIAVGVLSETPLSRASDYVRNLAGADFLHRSAASLGSASRAYRRSPSAANLRSSAVCDRAVPTLVYTVNDARLDGLATHLAAIGVSGIFTDDPTSMRSLWAQ